MAFAVLLAAVGIVVAAGSASAQGVAGLVLETAGSIDPPVRAYTEIPVGSSLTLSDNARLVFVHYQTCRTVTVLGGTVTITAGSYITKGGKQSDERTPCPKKVTVRGGGELGGVVYRSVATRGLTLPAEAAFVVSGPRASDFTKARITRDGNVVAEGPITDQVFRWPPGTTPLSPDTAFELTLVPTRADGRPVTIRFATPAVAAPASQAPLVVIGVD